MKIYKIDLSNIYIYYQYIFNISYIIILHENHWKSTLYSIYYLIYHENIHNPLVNHPLDHHISHHQLILSRCYGGASRWPNWSRSCEDSIGSPRDSPQRPGWAWGNATEILQQRIQHDSTKKRESVWFCSSICQCCDSSRKTWIDWTSKCWGYLVNQQKKDPTRYELGNNQDQISGKITILCQSSKGFSYPMNPISPIIIHYPIYIKFIFPSVISYPMYIPMIIHYPMNIPIMPWISHGTHRFSREHAGHPGPPRSLASAWTAASDISMEWLRRLAGLAGLPSSWIQNGCVKTNSTPVVHIKIAGIYGCSFP